MIGYSDKEGQTSVEDGPNGSSLKSVYLSCDCSFFSHLNPPIVTSHDSICTLSIFLDVWSGSLN